MYYTPGGGAGLENTPVSLHTVRRAAILALDSTPGFGDRSTGIRIGEREAREAVAGLPKNGTYGFYHTLFFRGMDRVLLRASIIAWPFYEQGKNGVLKRKWKGMGNFMLGISLRGEPLYFKSCVPQR